MGTEQILVVVLGALVGGLASGLTGFGTGITAMGIWLYALSPTMAATLVIICSIAGQIQTLPRVWHAIDPKTAIVFIIPGLAAVPVGTVLLSSIDATSFKLGIGCILMVYSSAMLLHQSSVRPLVGSKLIDGVVGFAGGLMGGLGGLSGPPITIWSGLHSWPKDKRRGIIQAFNSAILMTALVAHALSGFLTAEAGMAAAAALPATFIGVWCGARIYRRLNDRHFDKVVLFFLLITGVLLIWTNLTDSNLLSMGTLHKLFLFDTAEHELLKIVETKSFDLVLKAIMIK